MVLVLKTVDKEMASGSNKVAEMLTPCRKKELFT